MSSQLQLHYCAAVTGEEGQEKDKELSSLVETLICPLCCHIPNRAKVLPCCSKHICSLCGINWFKTKSSCPYCRAELLRDHIFNGLPDAQNIQEKIDELNVFCPFFDDGCDWVNRRSGLISHLEKDCRIYNGNLHTSN